jgi:hypothetical protein
MGFKWASFVPALLLDVPAGLLALWYKLLHDLHLEVPAAAAEGISRVITEGAALDIIGIQHPVGVPGGPSSASPSGGGDVPSAAAVTAAGDCCCHWRVVAVALEGSSLVPPVLRLRQASSNVT